MGANRYDFVTIYRGRDSVTYLMSDWLKDGDNATPYQIRQNPSDREPFVKMSMEEADGFYQHNAFTKEELEINNSDKWDKKQLKKLLSDGNQH